MKLSPNSLLCALALGLALAPAISRADYQPADRALAKLESVVKLTSDQEKQALQIFQNLKDVMDDMSPADRTKKGAQSRQDALAAIRSILTPDQQAIYDQTPQRLGGGGKHIDPAMAALHLKIRTFVANFAKSSPDVAAQVGTVISAMPAMGGDTTQSSDNVSGDPALHPDSGTSLVRVKGSKATETIKVYWSMDEAGAMTVSKFDKVTS